jgi:hypothetical protein
MVPSFFFKGKVSVRKGEEGQTIQNQEASPTQKDHSPSRSIMS